MEEERRGKRRESRVEFPHLFNLTLTTDPHFQKPGSVTDGWQQIKVKVKVLRSC